MNRLIPRAKLSKRARRELDRQRRQTWDFRPITRKIDSAKRYNRKKTPRDRGNDYGAGRFFAGFPGQYILDAHDH